MQFAAPLDENEVSGIAKSIGKWTYQHLSAEGLIDYVAKTHTIELQSIRGKKGGKISRGGGRKKVIGEPWLDLGISRSTWYRKKLKGDINE